MGDLQLALPGEAVTFTITVTNQGDLPATNVSIVDDVPPQLIVDGATATQGTFTINGNRITFDVGTLNPAQTVTFIVRTHVRKDVAIPSDIVNTAVLSFAEGSPRQASWTVRVTRGTLPATGEEPLIDLRFLWIIPILIGLLIGYAVLNRPRTRPR